MAYLLTAVEVVEQALRKIGAYSINDAAAEPSHVAEGLAWLDLNMAELAGVHKVEWLVSQTLSVSIVAGQTSYNLANALGSSLPVNGISFITEVHYADASDNRTPVTIVRRDQWEALGDPDQSGTPEIGWIDRTDGPRLWISPIPSSATGSLKIVLQELTADFNPNDPGANRNGNQQTGLRAAWQRWAIFRLAADLGDGTVHRVPTTDLQLYENKAGQALERLLAYENREHDSLSNRRVAAWGL